jgi:hypothetical protein
MPCIPSAGRRRAQRSFNKLIYQTDRCSVLTPVLHTYSTQGASGLRLYTRNIPLAVASIRWLSSRRPGPEVCRYFLIFFVCFIILGVFLSVRHESDVETEPRPMMKVADADHWAIARRLVWESYSPKATFLFAKGVCHLVSRL